MTEAERRQQHANELLGRYADPTYYCRGAADTYCGSSSMGWARGSKSEAEEESPETRRIRSVFRSLVSPPPR